MRSRILLTVGALLATGIAAGEPEASDRVHLDLDALAAAADVQPVGGLRSSGQPDAADLEALAAAGYTAVIDLRGPDENRGYDEAGKAMQLGLDYVSLPIVGAEAISFENARKLDALLEDRDGPVLIHCGSGNRVGALLALRQSLAGDSDEAALAYGRSAGLTRLEPVVKQRLADD